MTNKNSTIWTGAALIAAFAPTVLVAQPPAAADVELPESRRIPAEQQAAAYKNPSWAVPKTSWGHPSLDPDMIEYRITIEDPDTYTAPFTVRTMWSTQPGYYAYEYSCHEGNSAVGMGLSGERAFERQVAEALAEGRPAPRRATGLEVYRAPSEDAEVFDINRGE